MTDLKISKEQVSEVLAYMRERRYSKARALLITREEINFEEKN